MATEFKLSYTANEINSKLGEIDNLAKKSEVPTTLADLEDDTTHRLVTDTEKSVWNSKANISDIPTKVSELANDANYETKSAVANTLTSAKVYTDTKVQEITESFSNVVYQMYGDDIGENNTPTIREIANEEANTALDTAKDLIDAIEIPTVPTNISAFTNDKGYLTEHQSLAGYAKTADLGDLAMKDKVAKDNLSTEVQTSLNTAAYINVTDNENITTDVEAAKEELKEYIDSELQIAKDNGEFDGKSAYQYAQDGGYTGTEAEFAEDINPDNIKAEVTPVLGKDYFTESDKDDIAIRTVMLIKENGVVGFVEEDNNIVLSGNIADGIYTLKYKNEDGTFTEVGTLEVGAIVTYTITKNLANVTADNSVTEVRDGESLTVNLAANSGYNMSSIKVTMGGTDITSTAVSGNKVTIASVTGNVVITAVATKPNYTNLFVPSEAQINKRVSNSYELKDGVGHVTSAFIDIQGKTPFTDSTKIYVKGATFNATSSGSAQARIITYTEMPSTPYTGAYSVLTAQTLTQNDEGNGVISVSGIASSFGSDIKYMVLTLNVSENSITTADIQNIVVTIDEPIV